MEDAAANVEGETLGGDGAAGDVAAEVLEGVALAGGELTEALEKAGNDAAAVGLYELLVRAEPNGPGAPTSSWEGARALLDELGG